MKVRTPLIVAMALALCGARAAAQPLGTFGVLAGTGPTSTNIAGAALASSADGILSIPLEGPVSVGGTSYRLSSIEDCMTRPSASTAYVNGVTVASDALTVAHPAGRQQYVERDIPQRHPRHMGAGPVICGAAAAR